jgi:hypothetical protein
MKTAKAWAEENTFALKFPDAATLIEAVQADALREAASVARDANCGRLEAADVLDDMADSLLSPNDGCTVEEIIEAISETL